MSAPEFRDLDVDSPHASPRVSGILDSSCALDCSVESEVLEDAPNDAPSPQKHLPKWVLKIRQEVENSRAKLDSTTLKIKSVKANTLVLTEVLEKTTAQFHAQDKRAAAQKAQKSKAQQRGGGGGGGANDATNRKFVFCSIDLPSFSVCDVSVSLLSIYCILWHHTTRV